MKINLNDTVSVKLTKSEANRLNEISYRLKRRFPSLNPHIYHDGEIYKNQLWCIIQDFGDMIYLGSAELPFDGNDIEL